jgi:hypothetical protein
VTPKWEEYDLPPSRFDRTVRLKVEAVEPRCAALPAKEEPHEHCEIPLDAGDPTTGTAVCTRGTHGKLPVGRIWTGLLDRELLDVVPCPFPDRCACGGAGYHVKVNARGRETYRLHIAALGAA